MSIEAMKQALEALEQLQGCCTDSDDGTVEAITVWCPEVIDDLRAAIEQAEKPRQWQGLTDEEKHQLNDALNLQGRFRIIDAIEAKLKERNK